MIHLHAENVLRSADGVTSPITFAVDDDAENLLVSLRMSAEALQSLDEVASATKRPLEDVISKAFILYKAAAEASLQGKAVGIAPNADSFETEFVGF